MNCKNIRLIMLALIVAVMPFWTYSCNSDLATSPIDEREVTSDRVYDSPENFRKVLAKLYAGLAVTGQQGPAGMPDIQGIDEGFSNYLRQYWVHQEIPTDEAVVGWADPGLPDFNTQGWGPDNDFVMAMYSRIFYNITLANEFIRNARGEDDEQIQQYNAEARFLRALSYWHALDLYGGNVPFVTEDDPIGAFFPESIGSEALFDFIESELLAIEDELAGPRDNEYGRADRAAAWTVLSKLYLNAEVYIGQPMWEEARVFAERVIDEGGYTLNSSYEHLFRSNNDEAEGIIFVVPFHQSNTQTFGGTNFIVHAAVGGSMSAIEFGIGTGWEGHRVTPQFVDKFDEENDGRALFHTDGQNRDVNQITEFTDGYAVTKWRNVPYVVDDQVDPVASEFVDVDYPMFRLADVYLMYAEATVRGGGGSMSRAVGLVNELRERAYGNNSGNISQGELTADFILDERARELYWEGHRRTDLIRYNYFTTSDYVWVWKDGDQEGSATSPHLNLYPIPTSDINANPNLIQNPGY